MDLNNPLAHRHYQRYRPGPAYFLPNGHIGADRCDSPSRHVISAQVWDRPQPAPRVPRSITPAELKASELAKLLAHSVLKVDRKAFAVWYQGLNASAQEAVDRALAERDRLKIIVLIYGL